MQTNSAPRAASTLKLYQGKSEFEIALEKKDFEALAKESNYTVRPVNGIKVFDETIPGVGNQRPIVRWAFEEEAKVGDIKRFNISNGYVIAQLVAKHKEGLMSVDEATATVLPKIRKEKKAEMIKDRLKSVTTLEDFAAAETTAKRTASAITMVNPTIPGAGREAFVIGTAFGLKEGNTSKLLEGESGVFMVQVNKFTPAVKLDLWYCVSPLLLWLPSVGNRSWSFVASFNNLPFETCTSLLLGLFNTS